MSKNMALRFIILVTFLTFQGLDCASFVEPSVDTIVTANQTKLQTIGVATFRWRYTVNSGDSGIQVDCRYYQGIDTISVVKKASQTAPLTIENTALSSRIEIITDPNDNGVVSFKLNRVSKNDPRVFDCRLLFVRDGNANEAKSKKITLNVLDRPTFTNCLQNLQTVVAGSTINFKCIVTGNPRPSLRCQLLNLQGGVISSYPSGSAQAQNITQGSFTASKSASYISCFAEAKDTGYINKTTPITVYSSPFRIANISQIASSEGTSIRFQWKQLTFRESGNVQLQGYKVEWWVSSQFTEFENRTIRTLGLPGLPQNDIDYYTQNTYVYFEMRGLIQKETYTFRVYGYNGYGDGTKSSTFDANPGFAGPYPKLLKSLESTLYLNEDDKPTVEIIASGIPRPSVTWKFHNFASNEGSYTNKGNDEYSFKYTFPKLTRTSCGYKLDYTISGWNNSVITKSSTVIVNFTPDKPIAETVTEINEKIIKVNLKEVNYGQCLVNYTAEVLDKSFKVMKSIHTKTPSLELTFNSKEERQNATILQVTTLFLGKQNTMLTIITFVPTKAPSTTKKAEVDIGVRADETSNTGAIVGALFGGFIAGVIFGLLTYHLINKRNGSTNGNPNLETNYDDIASDVRRNDNIGSSKEITGSESNYAPLDMSNVQPETYMELQSSANKTYVNVQPQYEVFDKM